MATTIVTKSGSGAPTASDLVAGELAVDLTNKRLYTEDSGGTVLELGTNPASDVTFGDNTKAVFGAGSDLQIYHDASHSYIVDAGTGNMYLSTNGNGIVMQASLSETMFAALPNGAVTLYHDNATKLATTATGIDVTGTVTADGLTVDGNASTTGVLTLGNAGIANAFINSADSLYINIDSNNDQAGGNDFQIGRNSTGASSEKIFLAGENGDISFYNTAGNSQALFWDASAESLGIGTSSVIGKLNLHGGTGDTATQDVVQTFTRTSSTGNVLAAKIRLDNFDTNHADLKFQVKTTASSEESDSYYTDAMTIQGTSGNVGIGGATGERLTVTAPNPTDGLVASLRNSGTSGLTGTKLWFNQNTVDNWNIGQPAGVNAFVFCNSTGSTNERMRIDASGNLLVNTTDTTLYNNTSGGGAAFMIVGDGIRLDLARDGDVATFNRMSGTGTLLEMRQGGVTVGTISVTASATAYNTSSDQRLKENIADADDAGSKIDSIQVRKYDWKADGAHQDYGMVAQELLEVAPEAVSAPEDPEEMMGVDYSKLVPMMLKEIQSLRARVAQLES